MLRRLRRLLCRVFGHAWIDHADSYTFHVKLVCERCGAFRDLGEK